MAEETNLENEIEELEVKAKSTLMTLLTNVKVVIGAVVAIISLVTGLWAIDDRYPKKDDLENMEGRIVSEFRSESAETRLTLIEDMESRLDEFDYDISILETNNEVVPEVLRIKRNMLYRRIEGLKNNNENPDNTD